MSAATASNSTLNGSAQRLTLPCPSSWITWACYWTGLVAAIGPGPQGLNTIDPAGAGVLLAAAGVFFASVILIQRHMKLSLLANSFGSPSFLVTSGPFQYSRNPIYAAFLVPIASLSYFSFMVAVVTGVVYLLAMNACIIKREERHLEAKFGNTYRAYKALVPRWLI